MITVGVADALMAGWFGGLAVGSPPAVTPAADEPIEMTAAEGLVIDFKKGVGRAKGGVVIRRRGVVVCCDRARAVYGQGRITSVQCSGNVVIHRADRTRMTAAQVEFRARENRLVLTGGVVVWRPDGRLAGRRMTYDLSADRLEVTGPNSTLRYGANIEPPGTASTCPRPVDTKPHGPGGAGAHQEIRAPDGAGRGRPRRSAE